MIRKTGNYIIILFLSVLIGGCSKTETTITPEDPNKGQWLNEVNAIDAYIKTINDTSKYIAYSSSGVRMVVYKFGKNAPPRKDQILNVNYIGKTFEKSSITFENRNISDVFQSISIVGLSQWFYNLQEGSEVTFFVPSLYAYSTLGNAFYKIKPNTTLQFDVTVNGIARTNEEISQFTSDTILMSNLLDTIPTAKKDTETGIAIKDSVIGLGKKPKPFDNVDISYIGYIFTNSTGRNFTSFKSNNANIFQLIDGLKIAIPTMREGGISTFYFPSILAFGTTGTNGVPANTNVFYVVTLNSIIK